MCCRLPERIAKMCCNVFRFFWTVERHGQGPHVSASSGEGEDGEELQDKNHLTSQERTKIQGKKKTYLRSRTQTQG